MTEKEYEAKLHEIDVDNDKKLNKLGLLPLFLDVKCKDNRLDYIRDRIHLSSHYNTFEEYKRDMDILFRAADTHKPIPVDIYETMLKANEEIEQR